MLALQRGVLNHVTLSCKRPIHSNSNKDKEANKAAERYTTCPVCKGKERNSTQNSFLVLSKVSGNLCEALITIFK